MLAGALKGFTSKHENKTKVYITFKNSPIATVS